MQENKKEYRKARTGWNKLDNHEDIVLEKKDFQWEPWKALCLVAGGWNPFRTEQLVLPKGCVRAFLEKAPEQPPVEPLTIQFPAPMGADAWKVECAGSCQEYGRVASIRHVKNALNGYGVSLRESWDGGDGKAVRIYNQYRENDDDRMFLSEKEALDWARENIPGALMVTPRLADTKTDAWGLLVDGDERTPVHITDPWLHLARHLRRHLPSRPSIWLDAKEPDRLGIMPVVPFQARKYADISVFVRDENDEVVDAMFGPFILVQTADRGNGFRCITDQYCGEFRQMLLDAGWRDPKDAAPEEAEEPESGDCSGDEGPYEDYDNDSFLDMEEMGMEDA